MLTARRAIPAALLVIGFVAAGCTSDEYVAPPPTQSGEVVNAAVAAETVAAFADAVVDGDVPSAAALGADPDAVALLSAAVDNAVALRLDDVSLRYVTETGRTNGADGWDGLVAVTWQVRGFDEASARVEVPMTFADGGRSISGIGGVGGTDGRLPLWLSGPLDVRRVPGAIIMSAGTGTPVRTYAAWARHAIVQARAVLGGRARLVVEVPRDKAALHRTLGLGRDEYAAIAAVTAPVDGSHAPGSPIHVFVNPSVYGDLDPVASQVVMTHEAVHAMTGAVSATGMPLWLVEGFADHVALRDVDLPVERTAGQILDQVRDDGPPTALPADVTFDPTANHLGAVYEAAWQVCVTIAEHGGEDALVRLYRAVRDGTDLATALREHIDWSEADLTDAWRARLVDLAGVQD